MQQGMQRPDPVTSLLPTCGQAEQSLRSRCSSCCSTGTYILIDQHSLQLMASPAGWCPAEDKHIPTHQNDDCLGIWVTFEHALHPVAIVSAQHGKEAESTPQQSSKAALEWNCKISDMALHVVFASSPPVDIGCLLTINASIHNVQVLVPVSNVSDPVVADLQASHVAFKVCAKSTQHLSHAQETHLSSNLRRPNSNDGCVGRVFAVVGGLSCDCCNPTQQGLQR